MEASTKALINVAGEKDMNKENQKEAKNNNEPGGFQDNVKYKVVKNKQIGFLEDPLNES